MQGQVPRSVQLFFPDAKVVYPEGMEQNSLACIDQVAFVTEDIDSTITYLRSAFGWGPFYVIPSIAAAAGKDGIEGNYRIKLAFVQVGSLEVELIQPLEGDTPFREHLTRLGAGIFHIRCPTNSVEDARDHLAAKGIGSNWECWDQGILVNAYSDRMEKLGLRCELVLDANALHAAGFKAEKELRSISYITE